MKVPADGHIVGWSVDLSQAQQGASRSSSRRSSATARSTASPRPACDALARPNGSGSSGCGRRAPPSSSSPLLGRRQYFTLNNPLEVKKGGSRRLTIATWVPNFAHDLRNDDLWRASRTEVALHGESNLTEHSHPHQQVGSTKTYGCTYSTPALLYWAYFVQGLSRPQRERSSRRPRGSRSQCPRTPRPRCPRAAGCRSPRCPLGVVPAAAGARPPDVEVEVVVGRRSWWSWSWSSGPVGVFSVVELVPVVVVVLVVVAAARERERAGASTRSRASAGGPGRPPSRHGAAHPAAPRRMPQ